MNWKLKAAAFQVLSALPGGEAAHYWVQRHVTRTLPRGTGTHAAIKEHARHFAAVMAQYQPKPLGDCRVLEFGAGRDLALALALRACGIGKVTCVDLAPIAKIDLVAIAAWRLLPDKAPPASFAELASQGIEYRAPFDMRASSLASASVDCVVSSEVMEHVDEHDVPAVLKESARILRPGGLAVMKIDYSDHYARGDPQLSRFNFLQYSDADWRRYNCAFQYVNRLRHCDFVGAFAASGFEVVLEDKTEVEPHSQLINRLAPRFRRYALADLFVQAALIVARKPGVDRS